MTERTTSGVDVVVSAFALLAAEEQEEAYVRIADVRLTRLADAEGAAAEYIRGPRRVADVAGGELTSSTYKSARRHLVARGEEIPDLSSLIRFFGSGALAKEALALSDMTTTQKIEACFRSRVAGWTAKTGVKRPLSTKPRVMPPQPANRSISKYVRFIATARSYGRDPDGTDRCQSLVASDRTETLASD